MDRNKCEMPRCEEPPVVTCMLCGLEVCLEHYKEFAARNRCECGDLADQFTVEGPINVKHLIDIDRVVKGILG